jgi:hypothetical protein
MMHECGKRLTGILLLWLMSVSAAFAAGLRAGVAKSVITPDVKSGKVYMAGFGNNRVAAGVHDDLYSRCLALSVGGQTLVMCANDVIGLFYDDALKIRARVQAGSPQVTHLIVASTHDHEGPDTMGLWGPTDMQSGLDKKYMDWLDDRIAATALEAVKGMQEARMTLAMDTHPLLTMLQSDGRPPYVKDPHLSVMRLDSIASGQPLATLVNWSDHPETLGSRNTLITADYPHYLCQYIEEHGGGTALFFNGIIGGLLSTLGNDVAIQDPETGELAKDGTWRKAELVGNTLGMLAERAINSAGKEEDVDRLEIRKAVIFAPMHNDRFRAAGALGIFKGRKGLYTDGKPDPTVGEKDIPGLGMLKVATGHDTQTEVTYIALKSHGKAVAEIVTIPGEIYPELVNGGITRYDGADYPDAPFEPTIRQALTAPYQFVFGLANDELGYIIPRAEWDENPPYLKGKKDRWYGEVNSAGPDVAGAVTRMLVKLIAGKG